VIATEFCVRLLLYFKGMFHFYFIITKNNQSSQASPVWNSIPGGVFLDPFRDINVISNIHSFL